MGRRATLPDGIPRLLGNHKGLEGKAFRRAVNALDAEYGPFSTSFLKFEAARVAVARVLFEKTTKELLQAQQKRRLGKGRRPNPQQIERLARRQGLADSSYGTALGKFQELVARDGRGRDLASRMQTALRENGER